MEDSELQVEAVLDLKEIVLANSTFGPAEIEQLTSAIASDFSNYAVLLGSWLTPFTPLLMTPLSCFLRC